MPVSSSVTFSNIHVPNHRTTCPTTTNWLPKEFPISLWHDHERSVLVAFDFTGGKGLLPKGECEKPPFWVSRCFFSWWSSKNIMKKMALKSRYTDFCDNKMIRSYLYLCTCIFIHHIQFVSYLLFKYCYIMLCIVFWCKWFPLAHGFSLVSFETMTLISKPCARGYAKSLQSRRFAALLSRHWTCFGAGEVWIKGFHKSLIFAEVCLETSHEEKQQMSKRLLMMPISIWSIPVFKFISQAEKGIWKVQTSEFLGIPGSWQGPLMRFVDSSANAGVLALFEATHAEKMWPVAWQAGKWGQPVVIFGLLVWKAVAKSITFIFVQCSFCLWVLGLEASSNMYCSNAGNTVQQSLWRILNFLRCGFKRSLPLPQRPASVSPWCPWTRWKRCFRWEELQV